MDFDYSPRQREWMKRIGDFMQQHIYPAEATYTQQMEDARKKGNPWIVVPVVEELKAKAKAQGHKIGLFRPITLWPFPAARLNELAKAGKKFLVVEMSAGQMVDDVRLAVNGMARVDFFGRLNGAIPSVTEVYDAVIKSLANKGVA